jgi:hypothetical protein
MEILFWILLALGLYTGFTMRISSIIFPKQDHRPPELPKNAGGEGTD